LFYCKDCSYIFPTTISIDLLSRFLFLLMNHHQGSSLTQLITVLVSDAFKWGQRNVNPRTFLFYLYFSSLIRLKTNIHRERGDLFLSNICLPPEDLEEKPGTPLTVAGWGSVHCHGCQFFPPIHLLFSFCCGQKITLT